MIKIGIVDDEKNMLELICDKICKYIHGNQYEITCFGSGQECIEYLKQGKLINILLCDIELNGMNGVELGKIVRKLYPEMYLIYLTSHSEFAIEGYKLDAYQYIMKDELDNRFPKILSELIRTLQNAQKKSKVVLGSSDKNVITYDEIVCIVKEKSSKYVRYKTKYTNFRERKTLGAVITELDSSEFLVVERGLIVNMKHIVRLKGNIIYLDNNEEIIISSARMKAVKKEISEFWREW